MLKLPKLGYSCNQGYLLDNRGYNTLISIYHTHKIYLLVMLCPFKSRKWIKLLFYGKVVTILMVYYI